jgi:hypothetical protein
MQKLIALIIACIAIQATPQSLPIHRSTHVDMGLTARTKIIAAKSLAWLTSASEAQQVSTPLLISPLPTPSSLRFASSTQFPLRTCLFFPYQGEIHGTWDFFARNRGDNYRNATAAWLTANGMDTIIFLAHNEDPTGPTSMFKNGYAGDVDYAQLAIMERWLQIGHAAGAKMIPTLFCDGDGTAAKGFTKHKRYFDLAIPFLSKYCAAISIGLESSECFSTKEMELLIAHAKTLTKLPIGTHMQWDCVTPLPRGLDFLLYEHSWHPALGNSKSVNEVVNEASRVINAAKIPVGFVEYNLDPTGDPIKQQSIGLKQRIPCVVVGGRLK